MSTTSFFDRGFLLTKYMSMVRSHHTVQPFASQGRGVVASLGSIHCLNSMEEMILYGFVCMCRVNLREGFLSDIELLGKVGCYRLCFPGYALMTHIR